MTDNPTHTPRLSKSRVVAGWTCPRYLWLKVHRSDADELEPSVADRDRMQQGIEVGRLATERFPGGVLIDFPHDKISEKIDATRTALANGADAIFEASFQEDGVFVAVNVLERVGERFRLIEVKATNGSKKQHIPDVAVQLHVLREAGLTVDEVGLMHLNPEFVHPGPEELFVIEDVTEKAEAFLPEIPDLLDRCRQILAGPEPEAGGAQCSLEGKCPASGACWPSDADHIRRLHGVGPKRALRHMADGVHTFGDLPPDANLRDTARRQLEAWKRGGLVTESTLEEDLRAFGGRLGFLDFETVMRAVPRWDGISPWGMVPVQFSYHERDVNGDLSHKEWIADGPRDPRESLALALIDATSEVDRVATYTSYEERCINALKHAVPELAQQLDELIDKLVDLKKVVAANLAHPEFHGSYSIKDVLTPLVPDLSYEGLEVSDGMTASVRLYQLMTAGKSWTSEDRAAERDALLAYCRMDTLAMVRLLEALESLVEGADQGDR